MDISSTLGIIGLVLLLIAFTFNLFKKINAEHINYILLNLFGGLCLSIYSWSLNAMPLFILQAVWTLFAGYKLIVILLK